MRIQNDTIISPWAYESQCPEAQLVQPERGPMTSSCKRILFVVTCLSTGADSERTINRSRSSQWLVLPPCRGVRTLNNCYLPLSCSLSQQIILFRWHVLFFSGPCWNGHYNQFPPHYIPRCSIPVFSLSTPHNGVSSKTQGKWHDRKHPTRILLDKGPTFDYMERKTR